MFAVTTRSPGLLNPARPQRGRLRYTIAALLLSASMLAGCGDPLWLPPAHKIEIQQGNLLTEEQIQSVTPGMTREAVLQNIGEPISGSAFHADRWDYVFTRGPAGQSIPARRFTVLFSGNEVTATEDNFAAETGDRTPRASWFRRLIPHPERENL